MALKGKVAVVTGSTSGIGLGIARALAREGCGVMLNGLLEPREAHELVARLKTEFEAPIKFHPANLARPDEIADLIQDARASLGSVDILVNNAGIQHVAAIEQFATEKWDAILAINLSSVFHATRAVLPEMRKRNWGRIVNIASTHGLVASIGKSAYVAAKHGVLGLTKVTALETATTGITCNAICPGWVLTPLVQKQIDHMAETQGLTLVEARQRLLAEKQPSLEFATPEQIGGTVVFLCSEAAAQMRGAALNVDGGWLAQ
jgi:3-hydroxybutyrate dehydrogenase